MNDEGHGRTGLGECRVEYGPQEYRGEESGNQYAGVSDDWSNRNN
jgi:hypothetical protein